MITRRGFFVAPLGALALAACQLLVGVTDPDSVARPDGGAEHGGPVDRCAKRRPPARPLVTSEAPDAGGGDYVFAVQRLSGTAPNTYDLDDRCTGIDASTTADPPCSTSGPPVLDEPGGGDNALGAGLKRLLLQGSRDAVGERSTASIAAGRLTSLIGVFRYSGLPNDPEVRVQVVPSGGLESIGCEGEDAGSAPAGPRWDGCDRWTHTPGAITGRFWSATQPAYVVDDVLVFPARDEFKVAVLAGEAPVHGAVMTARIVRDAQGVVVGLTDGILAGRFAARDVLSASLGFEALGSPVCRTQLVVDALLETVCDARDVPLRPADDGKGLACDAVSFAFGFDAHVVTLGSERAMPAPDCDGGVDFPSTCPK